MDKSHTMWRAETNKDVCSYYPHKLKPFETLIDSLSLQVGLKDHRCLMCPATQQQTTTSCHEEPRSSVASASFRFHLVPTIRRGGEQLYLRPWLPCWTSGSTTAARALQTQRVESQTRRNREGRRCWVEATYRWTSLPSWTGFTRNTLLEERREPDLV